MGIAKTRKLAFEIIYAVCEEGAKSHLRLADTFAARKDLTVRDRAVITNLVHGTLENLRLIDYRIDEVAKLPAGKMKPKVRCAVRLGFYQLLFLDRTSESAAIRDSVELVRKAGYEGLTGFVNGVLRTAAKETDKGHEPGVERKKPADPAGEPLEGHAGERDPFSGGRWLAGGAGGTSGGTQAHPRRNSRAA